MIQTYTYRDVTRLDGVRGESKFGARMFEPEVSQKKLYCIEESTCDVAGTFQSPPQWFGAPAVIPRPHNDSAPGELFLLCPPPLRPCAHICTQETSHHKGNQSSRLKQEQWKQTIPRVKLKWINKNTSSEGHRRSQGVKGVFPHKFLALLVILCFEKRYHKQNTVAGLKQKCPHHKLLKNILKIYRSWIIVFTETGKLDNANYPATPQTNTVTGSPPCESNTERWKMQ